MKEGPAMQQTVQKIYDLLAAHKIINVYNCMTRLRMQLEIIDGLPIDKIKKLDDVLGVILNGNELQIIVGPGKAEAMARIMQQLLDDKAADSSAKELRFGSAEQLHAAVRQKNATPFKLMLKKIAGIFLPLIPAFIACGLITGILNIALKIDPGLSLSPIIKILQIAGTSVFWGINIFVGVNTAKECGASPMLGGTMAAIITHPSLADISLFGEQLSPGRGGIIAVLLVVAFSSWLEKKLHKIIPQMFDLFLTPLLVILVATFPALFILQPLGGIISDVIGQVGASIAVYLKTKNADLKKTIISALPVGIMGIGEPLIYGVTMPLGKPFFTACIGGAFGGSIQAMNNVGASVMGISGLPLAAGTDNIPAYLLGLFTAYAVGFIATYLVGFDDPE